MDISVREPRAEAARDVAGRVRGDLKSVASVLHSGPTKLDLSPFSAVPLLPTSRVGRKAFMGGGLPPSWEPMTIERSGSFLSSAVGPDHGPRIRLVFGIEDRSHFDWQFAILLEWLAGQADDRRQKETS